METMILTFVALLLIVAAMSIGVMLGRKPIAGSCGGMSALGMETACEICGGDQAKCDEEQERRKDEKRAKRISADLAYEVKSNS